MTFADTLAQYVGRWTAAPNRLRFDGSFPGMSLPVPHSLRSKFDADRAPGVYFDLNVTNTSSLVLSLQNARPEPVHLPTEDADGESAAAGEAPQYRFGSAALKNKAASPPVSLIALVDGEEYVILPNATSLVTVRMHDMNPKMHHTFRVVAPMTDNDGKGVVQFDGLWLDKGGSLLPVEGTAAEGSNDEDDDFSAESDEVGKKHKIGFSRLLGRHSKDQVHESNGDNDELDPLTAFRKRRKLLEIVTDQPSHLNKRGKTMRQGGADSLLAGVMGWEYLLGEMFAVDHVTIGVEGVCLTHDCIGGTGSPNGMRDVFFRRCVPNRSWRHRSPTNVCTADPSIRPITVIPGPFNSTFPMSWSVARAREGSGWHVG